MLSQKIALETAEPIVKAVAGRFTPISFRWAYQLTLELR